MKNLIVGLWLISGIIYGSVNQSIPVVVDANECQDAIDILQQSALEYEKQRFAQQQGLLVKRQQQQPKVLPAALLSLPWFTYAHQGQRKTLPRNDRFQEQDFFKSIEAAIQESEDVLAQSAAKTSLTASSLSDKLKKLVG